MEKEARARIDRQWEERGKTQDDFRQRMRANWRNDDYILTEYFRACVVNWKAYSGEKLEKHTVKLYGIYKQATVGDCPQYGHPDPYSVPGRKWAAWHRLRGMPLPMAKRRFITYLAEIDPLLIDVMPNEVPPEGFPGIT